MTKHISSKNQASPVARDHKDGGDYDDRSFDSGESEDESHIDDEYEGDDDDSFWSDFKAAWKHHMIAIMVSVFAAFVGLTHLQEKNLSFNQDIESTWQRKESRGVDPISHAHLEKYYRMSNVSFCYNRKEKESKEKDMLSFKFQMNHLSTIEQHYLADFEKDDYYHNAQKSNDVKSDKINHRHISSELTCAYEQLETENKKFLTGWVPYYKAPSIEEIAKIEIEEGALSSRRNRFEKGTKAASLSFTGFAAKFINLSNSPKLIFWDGRGGRESAKQLVAEIAPFESVGTATTPGQSFSITPVYDSTHALQRWTLTADEPIQVYRDPADNALTQDKLSKELWLKYQMQELSLAFGKNYLVETKRHWLANFPRPPPSHFMWPAEYIGQLHTVKVSSLATGSHEGAVSETLKLKVSSVVPRVLEIENFLSESECLSLIKSAQEKGLHPSTVIGSGSSKDSDDSMIDTTTRSSKTTWLSRSNYELVDSLYRRAADVLQLEDSALQHRSPEFIHEAKHHSTAEDLQIVHYANGQEYTPHHDFVYPSITNRFQPMRFATLLIYLKDPQKGGETTFPRSLQTKNHDGLVVKPKQGKAILFYNILPDGNVDDVSQHGSRPVEEGEKWIANLWIWDPIID